MEQRNNLVLQGTETFSRGQLDNVALDGGALVLDSVAGRCLQYGSYTTPEFAMPAFCNLNVSWNAFAPHNTMVEVRCRVYAGGNWTGWMSFGKWAPGYPRCSCNSQSDDGMIFLMGDTVTVATPGGGTGVQLQVNLSTNDDKVSPAVRLLAAAVRPLAWEKHNGHPLNRQLYLPEYCLSAHDPSFGRTMDLPLVMAALMNCWGEDVLPEEVAYVMEDMAHSTTANAAFAAAAAGCCGYPCWQAWMDLADLRAQIHDDCSIAVRVERRIRGQRDPVGVWMGLRGFGHDDAVLADFVLLNDPTADSDGAVNCTMALTDFMRYFTGRAIALRPKQREVAADLPNRVRCDLTRAEDGSYFFEPERTLSRGRFIAMALAAMDVSAEEVQMTGFCDDASIPSWAKGYAVSALNAGVVSGISTAEGAAFRAGDLITLNEAAVVLNRLLRVTDVDLSDYDAQDAENAWCAQAVANLQSVSIIESGRFSADEMRSGVTRAQTAEMLSAAMTLRNDRNEKGGLLSGLFG